MAGSGIVAVAVKRGGGDKRDQFEKALRAAEATWTNLRNRWEQDASDRSFHAKLEELKQTRRQWEALPRYRHERYGELETQKRKGQLQRFLERYPIDRASIPGLGPTRKAMLESYGIDTAWSITEKAVMVVPGFGPALTRSLVSWRRSVEVKFRFDTTKGVDPSDIAALDREIDKVRQKLEAWLLSGASELTEIRVRILSLRTVRWRELELSLLSLLEAEVDRNTVGK